MATALTPLANITLGAAAASVTFSSISGAYRDLMIVMVANAVTYTSVGTQMTMNGSPAASGVYASGNGSTAVSGTNSGDSNVYFVPTMTMANGTTEPFNVTIHLFDYSATDKHKSGLLRANRAANTIGGSAGSGMQAFRYATTTAVTSLVISSPGDTFAVGSSFALYGVSA